MNRILNSLRRLRELHPWIRPIHRVARRPYYMLLSLLFPCGIATRLASKQTFRLHPLLLGMRPETYEAELTSLLLDHVEPGTTVVDIGAHLGLHTLTFSRLVGAEGKVLAVEASPANARLLRSHVEWNKCKNVTIIEAAVGDRNATVPFGFHSDPTDPAAFANSLAYDIGGDQALVPMLTIDAICDGMCPSLIKIDIEGAELLALRGATKTLNRTGAMVVVAIHPDAMQSLGTSPSGLIAFLETQGYIGRHLDGRPVCDPGFEEIIFTAVGSASSADIPRR